MTVVAVAALCALAAAAPGWALLPAQGRGVGAEPTVALDAALRAELASRREHALLDEAATRAGLASAAEMQLGCAEPDAACAARIGELLAVDVVIVPSVRRVDGVDRLIVEQVDVARAAVVRRARVDVPAGRAARAVEARALVDRLASAAGRAVTLAIVVDPPDARVRVDGEDATTPNVVVEPGVHVVEATAPGRAPARASIDAKPGEVRAVALTLPAPVAAAPAPPPPSSVASTAERPVLLGAGLMAGGGAVLVGGVGLGLLAAIAGVEADASHRRMRQHDADWRTTGDGAALSRLADERVDYEAATTFAWSFGALTTGAALVGLGVGAAGAYLLVAE